MVDIELVIKIPEDAYNYIKANGARIPYYKLTDAIKNGTPLPKGHGRLLDEKEILNIYANGGEWYDLEDMPEYIAGVQAIIEATKESE